ncbi:MAG: UDP-N-acetylglucosamine 2-epimerase [Nitrosopumilus sp.]|nr:UDP-N-acetylglucosamine 2-epimerase [Nitrosopumilus sp.]|tara:strand:- start:130 stop:1284 length:1155 start_codon:yes stop_codon:yes gene_type:complete
MLKRRKILVTTGTRAEYGILRPILEKIETSKKLDLLLVVTGTHNSKKYGMTINEIKKDGFKIAKIIKILPKSDTPYSTSQSLGEGIISFSKVFKKLKPDINLILGDRDEMLAAAISAYHMNIPNAHIHGGDKSGGLDEYNRHAITKISNIHFPATEKSKKRILKMGENSKFVFLTGSPSVDEIKNNKITNKKDLENIYGINFHGDEILLVYHSVTTQLEKNSVQIYNILNSIVKLGHICIVIAPNSDTGRNEIFCALKNYSKKHKFIKIFSTLPRSDYLGMLKNCGVLVGNSSSGMIEASYFQIPVVNIGIRQKNRERGKNVIDVNTNSKKLVYQAIQKALKIKKSKKPTFDFTFGKGNSAQKIVAHLENISLGKDLIQKELSY